MSEVIKTLGHYSITEATVDTFISALPKEQQMYRSIPDFRQQVIERIEEITLFALYSEELKLEETDEYKDALEEAKRDIGSQLAMRELLKNIDATDEEVAEFYKENPILFKEEAKATAKHILVDTEEKANEIKAEIEAGTKSFEEAAMEYSTCPSGKQGGSLGSFGRGQMVKEFDNAAFTGELHTLIGPVETQFGYHLIYIDDRTDGEVPPLEEISLKVKKSLIQKKQQDAYEAKLAELKTRY